MNEITLDIVIGSGSAIATILVVAVVAFVINRVKTGVAFWTVFGIIFCTVTSFGAVVWSEAISPVAYRFPQTESGTAIYQREVESWQSRPKLMQAYIGVPIFAFGLSSAIACFATAGHKYNFPKDS